MPNYLIQKFVTNIILSSLVQLTFSWLHGSPSVSDDSCSFDTVTALTIWLSQLSFENKTKYLLVATWHQTFLERHIDSLFQIKWQLKQLHREKDPLSATSEKLKLMWKAWKSNSHKLHWLCSKPWMATDHRSTRPTE